jgi:oleate hydratase
MALLTFAGIMASGLRFEPDSPDILVTGIELEGAATIAVGTDDIVFVTLGSMTSSCVPGKNDTAPASQQTNSWIREHPDPVWKFWDRLADPCLNPHAEEFGDPRLFRENAQESSVLAFTTTVWDPHFVSRLLSWAGSTGGTCPLTTFRDCPWMLSITVPKQPYFSDQAEDTTVFWGYGIYPDQPGRFVTKPMANCSGREILTELLMLLGFETQPTLDRSVTLPVLMPFLTSPYATRGPAARPRVVPDRSRNLALLGQFVEMERDVTFTMEYSVRSAQTAVYRLAGVDRQPPSVHGENPSAEVLGEALKTLMV